MLISVYIPVSAISGKQLFLSVFSKAISPRAFNVKITQLQTNVAPDGCLQYFTTTNGVIQSFNYDEDGIHVESREASYLVSEIYDHTHTTDFLHPLHSTEQSELCNLH